MVMWFQSNLRCHKQLPLSVLRTVPCVPRHEPTGADFPVVASEVYDSPVYLCGCTSFSGTMDCSAPVSMHSSQVLSNKT